MYRRELPDAAYGQRTVIARMRRGKYVVIPPAWRGRCTHRQTIKKRAIRKQEKKQPSLRDRRAPLIGEQDLLPDDYPYYPEWGTDWEEVDRMLDNDKLD